MIIHVSVIMDLIFNRIDILHRRSKDHHITINGNSVLKLPNFFRTYGCSISFKFAVDFYLNGPFHAMQHL